MTLGETLIVIWRQVMVDTVRDVVLNRRRYPVRLTKSKHLRSVGKIGVALSPSSPRLEPPT